MALEGVVSAWALASGLQRGGCGVGWRERCDESVLIGPACCVQALVGHYIGVLVDAWKRSLRLPINGFSESGV